MCPVHSDVEPEKREIPPTYRWHFRAENRRWAGLAGPQSDPRKRTLRSAQITASAQLGNGVEVTQFEISLSKNPVEIAGFSHQPRHSDRS
jgi:hypothetical protein